MGVAINFVILPLSSMSEIGIMSCGCHAAAGPTLLVVIQKVLPLNHKDVGMRCNEGPNVWSSKWMYYQPIYLQNNCTCRDPIYELLNSAKLGSRKGLLSEANWTPSRLCTFADYSWVNIKDTLRHLTWFHNHKYLYHMHAPIHTAHLTDMLRFPAVTNTNKW